MSIGGNKPTRTGEGVGIGVAAVALLIAVLTVGQVGSVMAEDADEAVAELRARAIDEGWTFTVGRTAASDRTIEQLCGLEVPEDWRDGARFESFDRALWLPERLDWRDSTTIPPARDQGECGSCWAFGTVGALECAIAVWDGVEVDLSEQWLVSCNIDGWGCSGGLTAHDYHMWKCDPCASTGAVLESRFPYVAEDVDCSCPYVHSYFITDWAYIGDGITDPSVNEIKQAILEYGPVSTGVGVDPNTWKYYTGGVFNAPGPSGVNHEVVIVGWDDTLGTDGVWILRNSWGTDWGEDGYMFIEYGCSHIGSGAACIHYPPANPDIDGDGVLNDDDNCIREPNSDQTDSDNDGIGDVCDQCPYTELNDYDNDHVCGDVDNCPEEFNPEQTDSDLDGIGDDCDNCPETTNLDQSNIDGDALGDACDDCPADPYNDLDEDGVCGDIDNCPDVYNPDQSDLNGDGTGDVCTYPIVVATDPAHNDDPDGPLADVFAAFDIGLNPLTVSEGSIRISGDWTGPNQGAVSYDEVTRTLSFEAARTFLPGEPMRVTIASSLASPDAVPMRGGHSWNFRRRPTCGNGVFDIRQDYVTRDSPCAIRAVDLNADLTVDLVVVHAFNTRASLLLNDGTGVFSTSQAIVPAGNAYDVAAADFDGDGDVDLAAANLLDTQLTIILNDGTGAFAPHVTCPTGIWPMSVCSGDFNGDGYPDLATANFSSFSVSVLLNSGDATFVTSGEYEVGTRPVMVSAADLNDDGFTDLASVDAWSNSVTILLNHREGTFDSSVSYTVNQTPTWLALADLDNDLDIDIVVVDRDVGDVTTLFNDGNAGFGVSSGTNAGGKLTSVAALDLDADGDMDILTTDEDGNRLIVLVNDGTGVLSMAAAYSTGSSPQYLTAADFDRDGDIDAATSNQFGDSISVFFNGICVDSDHDGFGDPDHPENSCIVDNCATIYNPDQTDSDGDGTGDACEDCCGFYTGGMTGNADFDEEGKRNLADISKLIDRVYISKTPLPCEGNGDTTGDTKINLADISRLIDHVYLTKQETAPCP